MRDKGKRGQSRSTFQTQSLAKKLGCTRTSLARVELLLDVRQQVRRLARSTVRIRHEMRRGISEPFVLECFCSGRTIGRVDREAVADKVLCGG